MVIPLKVPLILLSNKLFRKWGKFKGLHIYAEVKEHQN